MVFDLLLAPTLAEMGAHEGCEYQRRRKGCEYQRRRGINFFKYCGKFSSKEY